MRATLIGCAHENTVAADGETVCTGCGVIVSDSMQLVPSGERASAGAKSATNVYERHVAGGREVIPEGMADLKRYSRSGSYDGRSRRQIRTMSNFSNCCEALGLDESVSEHALGLFRRALRRRGSDRRTAEAAAWAIYRGCKSHGVPLAGNEIAERVRQQWGRARMRDIMGISYDMMDMDVSDDEEGSMKYHFRLVLRTLAGRDSGEAAYARREALAWKLYTEYYTAGSHSRRARNAVRKAFGMGR